MSSLRGRRDPSREGIDGLGDAHYPGTGAAAQGEIINPALKPGDQADYAYDWARTWPSGSNPAPVTTMPGDPGAASPLEPGGVNGPNASGNGLSFWVSRSGGQGSIWYYWIDVDNAPGPDTKRNLVDFLGDDAITYDYRDDVMQHAATLGWTP